ncbi:protein kinase domain-containing protein (plasmid) [Rhodococcus globerulus]|uniref:protein kinase domain-containing protein n=1 Tax=Rhodococcus globerulus TaxID=33008 RepID=UPI0039E99272
MAKPPYELHELGRGGFATVHRATSKFTGEEVALKQHRSDVSDARECLIREISVQREYLHQNVMPILDAS